MTELEKSPFGKRTHTIIKNAKKVDRLTNPAYDVQAQKSG